MRRLLFLMSDTGGGHRAATRAIIAALEQKHKAEFETKLVDMWRDYTNLPKMPEWYGPWINNHPQSYEANYWLSDRIMKNPALSRIYERSMFGKMQHLYTQHPSDIVVCVHSVFVRPSLYAREKLGLHMPFVSVVTDYALPTVLWYDQRATKTLVPTPPALERGQELGLDTNKLILTGPIIHPRFTNLKISKAEARTELGWQENANIILLVGGGDGMGALFDTARAIDAAKHNAQLVVVAGKNNELKSALENNAWQKPTRIYGFVNNMEVFLRASDLLISKAGPASIVEAANMGVPLVLNGAIKYQESPNAEYVVQQGAGLYAEGPVAVANAIEKILNAPEKLAAMQQAVQKLAVPDATEKIAAEIWDCL